MTAGRFRTGVPVTYAPAVSLIRRGAAALLVMSAALPVTACGSTSSLWRSGQHRTAATASQGAPDAGPEGVAHLGSESGGSCADVKKVVAAGAPIFTEISKISNNPPDANQQQAALDKVKKELTTWAGQVRAQAPKVKNATLRGALNDMATGIEEATAEFTTFPDLDHASLTFDSPKLNQSRQKVRAICK